MYSCLSYVLQIGMSTVAVSVWRSAGRSLKGWGARSGWNPRSGQDPLFLSQSWGRRQSCLLRLNSKHVCERCEASFFRGKPHSRSSESPDAFVGRRGSSPDWLSRFELAIYWPPSGCCNHQSTSVTRARRWRAALRASIESHFSSRACRRKQLGGSAEVGRNQFDRIWSRDLRRSIPEVERYGCSHHPTHLTLAGHMIPYGQFLIRSRKLRGTGKTRA